MTTNDYECRTCHQGMYVPDGCDPLDEDVRFCSDCMVVELERLQAIVDKLYVTKDNVRVVPGMTLWYRGGEFVGDCIAFRKNTPSYTMNPAFCCSTADADEKAMTP